MLYPRFKKYAESHALFFGCKKVVVAVSGGPDSMTLLHLTNRLCKRTGIEIICAHVNYQLRGKESDADEKLVSDFCEELKVPFFSIRKKPAKNENLQDSARQIRRDFFTKLASKESADAILLAHHEDDQAETILLHLLRGAGLAGLSGMPKRVSYDGHFYIRPLLFATKSDILSYAKENRVPFRTDKTNLRSDYSRNALRLKVVPLLEQINPKATSALAHVGEIISDENDFMSALANEFVDDSTSSNCVTEIAIPREDFVELPIALKRRVVIELFRRLNSSAKDLNSDQIEKIIQISTSKNYAAGSYRLPFSCKFERVGNVLRISKTRSSCDR